MGAAGVMLLAAGLSMDAFAVSVCKGLSLGKIRLKDMFIVGAWFGIFQAVMPLTVFFWGLRFRDRSGSRSLDSLRTSCADWRETWFARRSAGKRRSFLPPSLDPKSMFLPALATSIDALAVGVTFAFLDAPGRDLRGSYRRSNIYDVCGGC